MMVFVLYISKLVGIVGQYRCVVYVHCGIHVWCVVTVFACVIYDVYNVNVMIMYFLFTMKLMHNNVVVMCELCTFVLFNILTDSPYEQSGIHSCSPDLGMCAFNNPVAVVV